MSRKVLQPLFVLFVLTGLVLSLVMSLPVSVAASSTPPNQPASSIQVEDKLSRQFETQGSAGYLIYLDNSKIDLSTASKMDWNTRGQFVMETLQKAAFARQAKVRGYLDAQGVKYQAFWIDNVIAVDSSTQQVFNGLTAFPEIKSLKARRTMGIIEPERLPDSVQLFAVESNLTHINADDVWALGYEGQNVTIANIDTGVRYTHLAVNTQYRGNLGSGNYEHNYNWFDPYGDHPTAPGDDNGHGTHTMGTMVGDDGSANQTGIAPSADWMACRACDTSSCLDSALLACAQFIAAPTDLAGANPDATKRPVAVNNSWGDCGTSYDNWYQGVVDAWHAAGIHPIFSNGNASNCGYSAPPGLNTVGNPARYGNVTGVGSSTQNTGQYATHSNWGPTDNPDTVNPSPNNAFGAALKPQVVAPGENIRSSVNTSDTAYESWAGTSMSAPHVTGLIALMVNAAPCLAGDYAQIETIIEDTAVPIVHDSGGSPAPPAGDEINYATGHGEIDALAAVQAALNMCGSSVLSGTVTDSVSGLPIAGVAVDVVNGTTNRHVVTNASGVYTLNLFDGTYDVTFSKYAYVSQTITGVVVAGSATQNAALVPATTSVISGVVTDSAANWPLYARLDIAGYPDSPIFTDPVTGAYSVTLPGGSYTFTVSAMSGGYTASVLPFTVTADATQDFGLATSFACTAPGYEIIAGTPVYSSGFDTSTAPAFPTDWAVADVSETSGNWMTATASVNPPGIAPWSAPNLVVFNSYAAYPDDSARLYQTSGLDLSGLTSGEISFWMYHETQFSGDTIQVQVSTDAGVTWNNVGDLFVRNDGTTGWAQARISIDAYTGTGMTDVRVGLLATSSWGNDIHVDDLVIGSASQCLPIADYGLVIGSVFDENTTKLLPNATVKDADLYAALLFDASADPATPDVMYVIAEPAGAAALTASFAGYELVTQSPTVTAGGVIKQDFNLPAGELSANALSITVPTTATVSKPLALNNTGGLPATYKVVALAGTPPSGDATGPFAEQPTRAEKFTVAQDASKQPASAPLQGVPQINAGEVSASWPTGLTGSWGIGFNTDAGDLWVGNSILLGGADNYNYNFTTSGVATGKKIDTSAWINTYFGADMTYNPYTSTLWQANPYGDNCAHELNPATELSTGNVICPAFAAPQMGLAFDPTTNTYYSGGWFDSVINHFASDGTILDSKSLGLYISGLAFNPSTRHLFVMTNINNTTGSPAMFDVYVLDTANDYMLLGGFNLRDGANKAFIDNAQAALEIDCNGKLWAVDQKADKVYMANSGETGVCAWKAPWLTITPATGTVAANGTVALTVKASSVGKAPGVYKAYLRVINNTPYGDQIIPVTMTVVRTERVKNGGFELYTGASKIPTSWFKSANFGALDGKTGLFKKAGKYSVVINGAPAKIKTLTQTLTLAGQKGNFLTFSYWTRANKLPTAGLCQAQVSLYNGTTPVATKTVKCPAGTTYATWKQAKLGFSAPGDFTKAVIKFTYSKASGTIWFDGASLIK